MEKGMGQNGHKPEETTPPRTERTSGDKAADPTLPPAQEVAPTEEPSVDPMAGPGWQRLISAINEARETEETDYFFHVYRAERPSSVSLTTDPEDERQRNRRYGEMLIEVRDGKRGPLPVYRMLRNNGGNSAEVPAEKRPEQS
jgi:hypothetical protein